MLQLKCVQCGIRHKANVRNFPIARKGTVRVKLSRKEQKRTGSKYIIKENTILGYLCRWCIKKHVKKENKHAAVNQFDQSIREAISSQRQEREHYRDTRADVPESRKNNIWGRIQRVFRRLRGAFLQNHDQSGVSAK